MKENVFSFQINNLTLVSSTAIFLTPINFATDTSYDFRFSSCILKVNHFYWPTNALNCIKLKG